MIDCALKKTLFTPFGNADLDLAFHAEKGSILGLFGPSGAGKTTLMRCLAGLIIAEEGHIILNGKECWNKGKKINLPPQKRNVGFVFQDYALFPNMTVLENLKFASHDSVQQEDLAELIDVMSLGALIGQKPQLLSGGQKQRVALARTLLQRPPILLLDEPLAAIDAQHRMKLQDFILKYRDVHQSTILLASHSVQEIYKLCDEVIHLDKGRICESGKPKEVFINRAVSGKFQFVGTILEIENADVVFIASILVQDNIIQVVIDPKDVAEFQEGEDVVVASKAFNPVIRKLSLKS